MVNSASRSASPYPTPESLPPTPESLPASPSPAPAAINNGAEAPRAESSRPKRKQRAPYKVLKRRAMGDLRPTPKSGEHEDVYAHRLWEWLQRGATNREGDKKMMWRGRNVFVVDAIRVLDEEARQSSRALPGGLQGFNGAPPMAFPQPAGPLQAQPFGAPMPFPQPAGPHQAQQQFGAFMPLQQFGALPAQPLGAFMPPKMQPQATMPNYQRELRRIVRGEFLKEQGLPVQPAPAQQADNLQGQQNPFPQPAPAQQVDYLSGPFMTLEEQQKLGVLDPEPEPAPAPVQQADNLQGPQNPFPQPALAPQVDYAPQGQQSLTPEELIGSGILSSEFDPAPAQQAEDLPAQGNWDLDTPPNPLPASDPPALDLRAEPSADTSIQAGYAEWFKKFVDS